MSFAHPQARRVPVRPMRLSFTKAGATERLSASRVCGVGSLFVEAVQGWALRGGATRGQARHSKDEAGVRLTQAHHQFRVLLAAQGNAAHGKASRSEALQSKDGADARLTQVHHQFEGAGA